ncbi:hypothetical protein OB2597_20186 [Pseudooceanicola batsensis HTCC2597]|uniref:Flagellar protein FlgJ N-terminal domain-containing protein n=1 Tax=Pseudooceanicola batsensis (strain ATCC BAA-863 / DSM 15984 / KCTC 12145 / HTCC2597) TaxID=252305 RepID=A3U0Z7_PSEBH|nr:rod-binding protein [Pseudooceanicola batsensis]EAQ01980.1 hypothetical protein OB2597_20186 [Pseudooceanicola batsensis HTCC2597]
MDISGTTMTALARGQAYMSRQGGAPDPAQSAGRDFESVFLTQVMEEMLKTVEVGSMAGGFAEETWRSFLARAYADELAARGTTGIAQSVEQSIGAYRDAMTAKGGAT